jgi:hypothetical protein
MRRAPSANRAKPSRSEVDMGREPGHYAVIKYRHDAHRDEVINVGVVLWNESHSALKVAFDTSLERVRRLYPNARLDSVKDSMRIFKESAMKSPAMVEQLLEPRGALFLSDRRTIQSENLAIELADLFESYVGTAYDELEIDEEFATSGRQRNRTYRYVKGRMNDMFRELRVYDHLNTPAARALRIAPCKSGWTHVFEYAYTVPELVRIELLSFDQDTEDARVFKARGWVHLMEDVIGTPGERIEVVCQPPTERLFAEAYEFIKKILEPIQARVVVVHDDDELWRYCQATRDAIQR